MRYWPTLLLFVILAGLGGYLYLVEFPAQQREEKQETEQKKLLSFPETADGSRASRVQTGGAGQMVHRGADPNGRR
jgi:hypothetical protein